MPSEASVRVLSELTARGYNADREAVTLLANAPDPVGTVERAIEGAAEDALKLSAEDVRAVLEADATGRSGGQSPGAGTAPDSDESVPDRASGPSGGGQPPMADADPARPPADAVQVSGDVTGRSTGTGEYGDFLAVFRDRFQRLSAKLRGRVNHRPTTAIPSLGGGSETGLVGMVSEVHSTANGHWLVELEDTNGTFPCLVMKDRELAGTVRELLADEVVAVQGTLSDDGELLFVDELHFPDVPRTFTPTTADRPVEVALVSDLHVGSQEFEADTWGRFADWLETPDAGSVEYLLIAGDMVEGVGVYPDQDEELAVVDIYDQYEAFGDQLARVPDRIDVRLIPGNHDAVRLAEPQPGFDEELRDLLSGFGASVHANPSLVTIEGVSILMYHGVSLDEVIAELPDSKATYDDPHRAMYQLLKKRHLAPQYGGHTRLAPEERDYLVIDEVPDVFHAGHVHKVGWGSYHNVLAINSGCWQAQTAFQASVNIDPDVGFAPILDLSTLDLTVRTFA